MSIQTVPQRLAECLFDSHEAIVGSYWWTQGAIEQLERPVFVVFVEDASYANASGDQILVEQGYSIAYIGHIYNQAEDNSLSVEYEQLTREIAEASVRYLIEHPQLQISDNRGILGKKTSLNGVQQMIVDGRSGVTLYSRDAVSGEAWWGFTIDVTMTEQFTFCLTGIP